MELYLREEGGSGEEARLSLGTAGERTQPQSRPAPHPEPPEVLTSTQALSRVPGRGGGRVMFAYLHSPTPHGGGAAGRGGDSQASNSCISHDTAAVRASWEQCPALGNRSSTRGWWWWLGGKVFTMLACGAGRGNFCSTNSSKMVPWRHAVPQSSAHRKALQHCPSPGVPCPASSLASLFSSL